MAFLVCFVKQHNRLVWSLHDSTKLITHTVYSSSQNLWRPSFLVKFELLNEDEET